MKKHEIAGEHDRIRIHKKGVRPLKACRCSKLSNSDSEIDMFTPEHSKVHPYKFAERKTALFLAIQDYKVIETFGLCLELQRQLDTIV